MRRVLNSKIRKIGKDEVGSGVVICGTASSLRLAPHPFLIFTIFL
jgi:hypothetical protein